MNRYSAKQTWYRGWMMLTLLVTMNIPVARMAQADATTDIFFEQLRRQESREEAQRRSTTPPDVRLQPERLPPAEDQLPQEQPCFTILHLRLDGDPDERFPWLHPLVDRYVGQCIGAEGVNVIVKRLQRELIARGFITTRVYIPEQDLTAATLTLALVPGVIRAIRFADDNGRGSWRSAFPGGPGDLLNLRDIEQGLEQIKRLPTQDIDMTIVPGDKPGESDIVIKRRPEKPWRVVLGLDNSGSEEIGKWQGSVTAAWDDPFGINDLFNVSWNTAERNNTARGARGSSAYYSFPFGYWTFTLSGSQYDYRQTVQGINQNFVTSGTTDQYDVRVHRLLYRSAAAKTGVQFRTIRKQSHNFIEDVEIEVQRRDVTAAEWALQHRHFVGKTIIDVAWAYRRGVPWFGAEAEPENQPSGAPTNYYRLQTLDASVAVPFTLLDVPARYSAVLRGQTTQDTLYGTDLFGIGNRYTVRGFDGQQTLAAERGGYIRNELGIALGDSRQEIYLGLDTGRVSGPSADVLAGRRLVGSAVGLRGQYGRDFLYDAAVGWALRKPDGFTTNRPVVTVQMSYQF